MYYAEVHYDVQDKLTQIHEGFLKKGKNEGIKRHMDWVSSALEWYQDDQLNGKQFLKWIKRDFCYKSVYKADEPIAFDFKGQDMTEEWP